MSATEVFQAGRGAVFSSLVDDKLVFNTVCSEQPGHSEFGTVFIKASVNLSANPGSGNPSLEILVEHSAGDNDWDEVHTFTFSESGDVIVSFDSPKDILRATVTVNGLWSPANVTVIPAEVNAPAGGGGGGAQPTVWDAGMAVFIDIGSFDWMYTQGAAYLDAEAVTGLLEGCVTSPPMSVTPGEVVVNPRCEVAAIPDSDLGVILTAHWVCVSVDGSQAICVLATATSDPHTPEASIDWSTGEATVVSGDDLSLDEGGLTISSAAGGVFISSLTFRGNWAD